MKSPISIDVQSVADSHCEPFVVIDQHFNVVALNRAYEKAYGTTRGHAIGRHCFEVSHGNTVPCSELGEDCPHSHVYRTGENHVCLHLHYDEAGRKRRVRVAAFPLKGADGEWYMGESVQELASPDSRPVNGKRMVGTSPAFLRCVECLHKAALSEAPVLLEGETGTGKELAARFIHDNSSRAGKPFLTLDCTALSESLFESEVFGYERGAFTGSVGEKKGLFELADGGTLFLDELGNISPNVQAKLLRVIETGEFRRIGGTRYLRTDVRIICATNSQLAEAVDEGNFREDLYYRVACMHIKLPTLNERLDDIPELVNALLEPISRAMSRYVHFTDDALERLKQHHYPGNVRELRNIVQVAVSETGDGIVDRALVEGVLQRLDRGERHPESLAAPVIAGDTVAVSAPVPVIDPPPQPVDAATREEMEKQKLIYLLKQYHGNRRLVARACGISERTVYRKLKRYKLR